jgi:hypothetical protein
MIDLVVPSWFKYRQGTAEPAGENCCRLSAPVTDDAFICIRPQNGRWAAVLTASQNGPELRATEPVFDTEADAWHAAFELYRAEKIY